MAHPTQSGKLGVIGLLLVFGSPSIGYAQSNPLTCTAAAVPTLVRTEGLAERMGDILLQCSGGTAGTVVSGNLNLFLPVSITNRIDANSTATGTALVVNTGGPDFSFPGRVSGQSIGFNGISFTVPASGAATLRISNLRANASQLGLDSQTTVQAFLSSNLSGVTLVNNPVTIARTARGMLATFASTGISCTGSPLPAAVTMTELFAAGTRFASTRVSEAFSFAFEPKDPTSDSGTRILVRYTGIPAGARLFVPDVVAGSDAATPTAGGDLGGQQSPGAYTPSSGALLLSRVIGADSNGAGGEPLYVPGPSGSPTVTLDTASEVLSQNGTGTVVYEVMDANALRQQTAQFPTFVSLGNVNASAIIQESVSFGPVSTDAVASTVAPVPRFVAADPAPDCPALGDCDSSFFPRLEVTADGLQFHSIERGAAFGRAGYVAVRNAGGGVMSWTATVNYKNGSGWLTLDVSSGVNSRSFQVFATPQRLAAGTYEATITVDASPAGGLVNIPVVLNVAALPPVTQPPTDEPPQASAANITMVTNAANLVYQPVAPGSQVAITGSNLSGGAVTFDGIAARILQTGAGRITALVPFELAGKDSAMVAVTVDGKSSAPYRVALAPVAPAVFRGGILNEDGSINGIASPAIPGSVLRILTTGLAAAGGAITVRIHDRDGLVPVWSGPLEGNDGVEEVKVAVPEGLPAMLTDLLVCAYTAGGERVCSHPAPVGIGQ